MPDDIRPVHVVAEDAKPGRVLTWGYGPAGLRQAIVGASKVAWALRGIEVGAAPGELLALLMSAALPDPLALVCAALGLSSSQALASDLERVLERAASEAKQPRLLHRRVLSETPIGPDEPCIAWGTGYLAALAGIDRHRAAIVSKRYRVQMADPVAVVQLALHLRGQHGTEAEVRRLLGARPIIRSKRPWR